MKLEPFCITGIAIRTTNENGTSANDIPQLWNKFISGKLTEQVTGKISNDIYCVYTAYEKDFTRPYTTLLGCRVEKGTPVPEGFSTVTIQAGNYSLWKAKGKLDEGIVHLAWKDIWHSTLKRSYTTDFEVYGEKASNPADAEVDIFVAIE